MGIAPGNNQGKDGLIMPDHNSSKPQGFATRMSHAGRAGTHAHGFVNPAVHRGSTVLMPNVQARKDFAKDRFNRVMTYGTAGGPTHYALEDVICEIEGGTSVVETLPSGPRSSCRLTGPTVTSAGVAALGTGGTVPR